MNDSIGNPILSVNRKTDSFLRDNIGMSIGQRVKEAREARGITQKELAKRAGRAQASLSGLENGTGSSTGLVAIAKALGVDVYWLETGKGEMEPKAAHPPPVMLSWITHEDADLLTYFHATDDEGREQIMAAARSATRVLRPSIVDDKS